MQFNRIISNILPIIAIVVLISLSVIVIFFILPTESSQEDELPNLPHDGNEQEEIPIHKMSVEVAFPNISFNRMVFLTHAGDGSGYLFLVLQEGQIIVFQNNDDVESLIVFLDIRDRVDDSENEEGLLGLAFDPHYESNGYFYVHYTASSPARSIISRFSVTVDDQQKADIESELVILQINQPYDNHNGGHIAFGPDGYLYIGLGDGGNGGDPYGNGQNNRTLLGTILRIDVSDSSEQKKYGIPPDNPFAGLKYEKNEIWAYGLRNPWRFSFDEETGLLWVGDVGQNKFEEIDIVEKGGNYGWNVLEGFHCHPDSTSSCDSEEFEAPIVEYDRDEGCSVTGGYVYRGSIFNFLYGSYIYGDFCSGLIWALNYDGTKIVDVTILVDSDLIISSFGEDEEGELYILSFDNKIYRLKLNE
ncbi:MAG: PQQ-dependent sugar dehydrogenase [Nitrososphaerales archaeon]|nr:PQQ-dependent sugar dehydrogenase [Nitrososphaerales archaeon]